VLEQPGVAVVVFGRDDDEAIGLGYTLGEETVLDVFPARRIVSAPRRAPQTCAETCGAAPESKLNVDKM
jgi:hypothetical protein